MIKQTLAVQSHVQTDVQALPRTNRESNLQWLPRAYESFALDNPAQATLERCRRLQVMHHAQRHGLVTLCMQVKHQAMRSPALASLHLRWQRSIRTYVG